MTVDTFPYVTHCESCGDRLQPVRDMQVWNLCLPCVKAAREFAKDLGPEHEQETEGLA